MLSNFGGILLILLIKENKDWEYCVILFLMIEVFFKFFLKWMFNCVLILLRDSI